jgi:hypothetical protein
MFPTRHGHWDAALIQFVVPALRLMKKHGGRSEHLRNVSCPRPNGNPPPASANSDRISRDSRRFIGLSHGPIPTNRRGRQNIPAILISVFNRVAKCVADTMARSKEQLLRPTSQQSNGVKLRDAERISARTALQHQAATDLLEATTLSLLRAIDISGPHAKTTEYLTMSRDERADVLTKSATVADANKGAEKTPTQRPQLSFRRF